VLLDAIKYKKSVREYFFVFILYSRFFLP